MENYTKLGATIMINTKESDAQTGDTVEKSKGGMRRHL
ncbi:hypothetical protein BH18THE2_BH18THE2_28010 [soil metagenome]